MSMPNGQYYLHTNGELIYKPVGGIEHNSLFVRRVWEAEDISRTPSDFLAFLMDAHDLGAKRSEIERLAKHNRLNQFIPDWRQKINWREG